MTTIIPVQHVGHELDMCCGTTCDAQLNKKYVESLEAKASLLTSEVHSLTKEVSRLQALVNISNQRRK